MPRSYGTSSTSPGGSDSYVQFNGDGSFDGDVNLTWDNLTKILTVLNINGIPETTLLIASPNATVPAAVRLYGGDATGGGVHSGGNIDSFGGVGSESANGGGVSLNGGTGGPLSGPGGNISIRSGDAGAGDANSGDILLTIGNPTGSGVNGHITFSSSIAHAIYDLSLLLSDQTFAFPNNSGTFALTSDIPTVPSFADNETPSGTIDSSNVSFTLANSPSPTDSLQLIYNGQFQLQGSDYSLSGNTVTFTVPPFTGTWLKAFYRY